MKKITLLLLLISSVLSVQAQLFTTPSADSARIGKPDGTTGISMYGDVYLKNVTEGLMRINAARKIVQYTLTESDIPSLSISKVTDLQTELDSKAPTSGSANYIQNQTASPQSASFNISKGIFNYSPALIDPTIRVGTLDGATYTSDRTGVNVSIDFDDALSNPGHAFADRSLVRITGGSYNSIDASPTFSGASTLRDHYAGFQTVPNFIDPITFNEIYGLHVNLKSALVTGNKIFGVRVDTLRGTWNEKYALYSADPTAKISIAGELIVRNAGINISEASTIGGDLTAQGFIKSGGTSSQFLKADGSVDANSYLTTAVTSLSGTANQITASSSTGAVTLSLPPIITGTNAGTSAAYQSYNNTGGNYYIGADNSTNSSFGQGAYAFNIAAPASRVIVLSQGGTAKVTVDESGDVRVSTPTAGDNSTKIATTAYVDAADAGNVKLTGPQTIADVKTFSSVPQITATPSTNSTPDYLLSLNDATGAFEKVLISNTITGDDLNPVTGDAVNVALATKLNAAKVRSGAITYSGAAQATFTISFGGSALSGSNYRVSLSPTDATTAPLNYYITNKTTTTFDLVLTATATAINYDYFLIQD